MQYFSYDRQFDEKVRTIFPRFQWSQQLCQKVMCGICFVLHRHVCSGGDRNAGADPIFRETLQPPLRSRGPDIQSQLCLPAELRVTETGNNYGDGNIGLWLYGSVLHIQGEAPAQQPYGDTNGNVLLWNGEVFGWTAGNLTHSVALEIGDGESDTIAVCRYLSSVCDNALAENKELSSDECSTATQAVSNTLVAALSRIHGPYAFIFYHKATGGLYFGRDPFGRRSLLLHGAQPILRSLASVGAGSANCVFTLQPDEVIAVSSVAPATSSLVPTETQDINSEGASRLDNWQEVGIDGIYCLQMAALTDSVLSDATTGWTLTLTKWPAAGVKLYRSVSQICPNSERSALSLHRASEVVTDPAHIFMKTLLGAVHRRARSMVGQANLVDVASLNENCVRMPAAEAAGLAGLCEISAPVTARFGANGEVCVPASKIGVLFSGGIDSVLLTALLHHTVHPSLAIDLLNVTFIKASAGGIGGAPDASEQLPSPDRVAAIAALVELQALFPAREWRLVHIDVGEVERYAHEQHIKDLIYPSDTHMDLNIGTAFWFASRGRGYLRSYSRQQLQTLFAATATSGASAGNGEGDGDGDGEAHTIKNHNKNASKNRPLLRHGGAGAAAGDGRTVRDFAATPVPQAPELVEISPGKFKCVLDRCNRVLKAGCERFMCKKCCDAAHRQCSLGAESSADAGKLLFRGALQCSDEALLNTCSAHRTTQKQLDKIKSNVATQAQRREQQNPPADASADGNEGNTAEMLDAGFRVDVSEEPALPLAEELPQVPANPEMCGPAAGPADELEHRVPYESRCKALLVGIGADEQMAGYGRHRSVYLKAYTDMAAELTSASPSERQAAESADSTARLCAQAGIRALETELNKDLTRLWKRNLGRDDRCISDNGKEAWFPFLDEEVVQLLQSLPMDQIADMSQPQGVGDKMILRGAAKLLGLNQCTELVKRAIQFGTRVAQHTNQHYHGSNRKGKGDTKI